MGIGAAAVAALGCGGDDAWPLRAIDCAAIAETYATQCGPHLGISVDTSACALVDRGQGGPLARPIDRAAALCEAASADATRASCDAIFVCVADGDGLTALTTTVAVTGTATVDEERFVFEGEGGYAWLGAKSSGRPGDFAALFLRGGRPWYFKLEDFAERARTVPFEIDTARPLKLESTVDNIELVSGSVTVHAFAIDGAFDIEAGGSDPENAESFSVRVSGSFASTVR